VNKFLNIAILEYSLQSIIRRGYKNLFIGVIFTALIFLLSSVLFISNSLKFELNQTVDVLPEIIVQKIKAGRQSDIETNRVEEILQIAGVEDAIARVWGYYYFEKAGVNFAVVGVNLFEGKYKDSLNKIVDNIDYETFSSKPSMLVGVGVKKILQQNYYNEYFNFIKPDGNFKKVLLAGTFSEKTELESNDIIILTDSLAREIFGIDEEYATDIVVKVANPEEIPTVANKIKLTYPDSRVITKKDLKVSYQNIFDYKSGIFLALFVSAVFTFFIIVYDKASGLSSEEKREIGILKALGWKIDDILVQKLYEALIIAFSSYLLGVTLSLGFVYILNAPLIRDIFTGFSILKPSFNLPFVLDLQMLALIFFLTIAPYLAATIIPSWRAATLEADEVIR
jgi:ABC-type lipoprotein release transport system permease subunit